MRVLAAEPDHLDALGNRGNALLKLNRVAEALASLRRGAARFAPDNAQLLDQPRRCAAPARSPARSGDERAAARWSASRILPRRDLSRVVARLTSGRFRRLARLRSALGGRPVGVAAAQFHGAAMARQGIARWQDHSAARRAGLRRHDPVRALCAASGRARRQSRSRSPALNWRGCWQPAGCRSVIARGQTLAAFRLSLSAAQPAAGFRHASWRRSRSNSLYRGGG